MSFTDVATHRSVRPSTREALRRNLSTALSTDISTLRRTTLFQRDPATTMLKRPTTTSRGSSVRVSATSSVVAGGGSARTRNGSCKPPQVPPLSTSGGGSSSSTSTSAEHDHHQPPTTDALDDAVLPGEGGSSSVNHQHHKGSPKEQEPPGSRGRSTGASATPWRFLTHDADDVSSGRILLSSAQSPRKASKQKQQQLRYNKDIEHADVLARFSGSGGFKGDDHGLSATGTNYQSWAMGSFASVSVQPIITAAGTFTSSDAGDDQHNTIFDDEQLQPLLLPHPQPLSARAPAPASPMPLPSPRSKKPSASTPRGTGRAGGDTANKERWMRKPVPLSPQVLRQHSPPTASGNTVSRVLPALPSSTLPVESGSSGFVPSPPPSSSSRRRVSPPNRNQHSPPLQLTSSTNELDQLSELGVGHGGTGGASGSHSPPVVTDHGEYCPGGTPDKRNYTLSPDTAEKQWRRHKYLSFFPSDLADARATEAKRLSDKKWMEDFLAAEAARDAAQKKLAKEANGNTSDSDDGDSVDSDLLDAEIDGSGGQQNKRVKFDLKKGKKKQQAKSDNHRIAMPSKKSAAVTASVAVMGMKKDATATAAANAVFQQQQPPQTPVTRRPSITTKYTTGSEQSLLRRSSGGAGSFRTMRRTSSFLAPTTEQEAAEQRSLVMQNSGREAFDQHIALVSSTMQRAVRDMADSFDFSDPDERRSLEEVVSSLSHAHLRGEFMINHAPEFQVSRSIVDKARPAPPPPEAWLASRPPGFVSAAVRQEEVVRSDAQEYVRQQATKLPVPYANAGVYASSPSLVVDDPLVAAQREQQALEDDAHHGQHRVSEHDTRPDAEVVRSLKDDSLLTQPGGLGRSAAVEALLPHHEKDMALLEAMGLMKSPPRSSRTHNHGGK